MYYSFFFPVKDSSLPLRRPRMGRLIQKDIHMKCCCWPLVGSFHRHGWLWGVASATVRERAAFIANCNIRKRTFLTGKEAKVSHTHSLRTEPLLVFLDMLLASIPVNVATTITLFFSMAKSVSGSHKEGSRGANGGLFF